jgi:bifunctional non-homologous end joining protein LigD
MVPMALSRLREPFDHPDWLFELKHDGFRALAYVSDGSCRLISRRHNVYKSFEVLKSSLSRLPVTSAVLDGEIVCLDETGKSIFKDVLYRSSEPAFSAFDLLWLNGQHLREFPLIDRKARLRHIVDTHRPERLLYAHHIEEKGVRFFRAVCERDLEGIVAKRKDGAYGIRSTWVKIKNPNYTQVEGRQELFDSMREQSARRLPERRNR